MLGLRCKDIENLLSLVRTTSSLSVLLIRCVTVVTQILCVVEICLENRVHRRFSRCHRELTHHPDAAFPDGTVKGPSYFDVINRFESVKPPWIDASLGFRMSHPI